MEGKAGNVLEKSNTPGGGRRNVQRVILRTRSVCVKFQLPAINYEPKLEELVKINVSVHVWVKAVRGPLAGL